LTEIREAITKTNIGRSVMSRTSHKRPERTLHELSTDLVKRLEAGKSALKARDLAEMFGVTQQHIYKLAALGVIPSFRVGSAVRFDPGTVAEWLRRRMSSGFSGASEVQIAV
jgi:excisionase family DNA binding protein